MKYLYAVFFISLSFFSFSQTYTSIEAVEYDPSENRFFVSNGSSIIERAANGDLSFFGDASANYGMEVMGDQLFAIYITGSSMIKGYDLETAEEVMSLTIPGGEFLNGMANDGVSKLWVTSFSDDKIYQIDVSDLENPSYMEIVNDTGSTPNGIVYDYLNDRLVFVSWGGNATIKEVDLDSYEVTILEQTTLGNIDGIDMTMQGDFYISSWSPSSRITRYNSDFSESEIIPLMGLSSPADISWADATDSLAIPNSGNNTVTFYHPEIVSLEELDVFEDKTQLKVVPNPVMSTSEIRFHLDRHNLVKIDLFDMQGKVVRTICDGFFFKGDHAVNLDKSTIPNGNYWLHVGINEKKLIKQVIFE